MVLNKLSLLLAYEPTGALVNTAGRESFTLVCHVVEQEIMTLLISLLSPKGEIFFDSLLQSKDG